ncbi:MAG: hypothetical protein RIQ75_1452, partial [Pseudomonadota bacterium]
IPVRIAQAKCGKSGILRRVEGQRKARTLAADVEGRVRQARKCRLDFGAQVICGRKLINIPENWR